jgi:phosphohistidine swiveling domain-containing protein
LPLREQGRRCLLAGYDLLRGMLAELAESSGLAEELYFLEWNELLRLPRSPVTREVLARRRGAWRYWRRHPPPPVIDGAATAPFTEVSTPASGSEWPVRVLATGDGEGPVWRPAAASDPCPRGAVVVTETADSAAVLRWKGAAAIVVEQGGRLSHAAVTARQIGLPLVVLPGGMGLLPTGSRVRVEADSGRLWILTEADPSRPG